MRITDRLWVALAAMTAVALAAGSAQAVPQFTPTATARAHTIDSGESGTTWNTGGTGVNGQVVYTASNTRLAIGAGIDVLHYYDPLNGGCSTDTGSDCTFNFGPNLSMSVLADFIGITLNPGLNGFIEILLNFESTGGVDIEWLDPSDGNSVMLRANWAAGVFQGFPTTGLQVIGNYCDGVGGCGPAGLIGDPIALGFAILDQTTPYADLFETGGDQGVILDLSELFDFNPTFNAIAAYAIVNGTLPDFAGEAQGQLFRVSTGEFVIPEPSTALLFGLGLAGLGVARRRQKF